MKNRIVINDTFTGANSTALTAHWPDKCYIPNLADAATWTTLTGHTIPQIQGDAASCTADATDNSAVIDINRHHLTIDADIRAGATTASAVNWHKFIFRCYDVSNWLGVQVGETSAASYNINILMYEGANSTTLATRTCTYAESTDYHINIKCTGNLIYVTYSDGGADLQHSLKASYVCTSSATNPTTYPPGYYAPGTKVGFWMYIAATSTAYPLIYNMKVLG